MGNISPSYKSVGSFDVFLIFHILEFSTFFEQHSVLLTGNKVIAQTLQTDQSYRWRLERLHYLRGIYAPLCRLNGETYKNIFENFYARRDLWENNVSESESDEGGRASLNNSGDVEESSDALPLWRLPKKPKTAGNFNISVCARFKPKERSDDEEEGRSNRKVTLPLHQRLKLIRASKKLKNNSQALNILKNDGEWFGKKWDEIEQEERGEDKENHISPKKKSPPSLLSGLHTIDSMNSKVIMVEPTKGLREYNFDGVLGATSSQTSLYESCAKMLVADFINGYNATILCYGQTGSGKTYSMFGPDVGRDESVDRLAFSFTGKNTTSKVDGIVPRACSEVLLAIERRKDNSVKTFESKLSLSYIEIYGDEVSDLLRGGAQCFHSKVAAQRYVLSGAAEKPVESMQEINEILIAGEKQKRKAATAMNERSSRAHCLIVLSLEQKCIQTGVSCSSKLFLADLGGSEQVKKSKVEVGKSKHIQALERKYLSKPSVDEGGTGTEGKDAEEPGEEEPEFSTGFRKGDRMREAVYINLGLLALKKVVKSLNSNDKKSTYVPYADSKLTMLLSSGLGGDSKTAIVVCASSDDEHTGETTSTLRFGELCSKIQNNAKDGTSMLTEMINVLDEKIAECERMIKKKERWEVQEVLRKDELAEEGTMESQGFGGMETKKITVLVGAEEDRKTLNHLLRKRAELTGTSLDVDFGSKYGGGVGFGESTVYDLGSKHSDETIEKNYRFKDEIEENELPAALKGKTSGWSSGGKEDRKALERLAKKANRRKMAYAGISA